jgi:PAS domain S-box-containing protein
MLNRIMSFASGRSSTTYASTRHGNSGLIERVLPDSQEIFHKASPVSLPGMPVSGGLDSSNRSERSTDSERQSSVKYQVADAGQFRTTSVYSSPDEGAARIAVDSPAKDAPSSGESVDGDIMEASVPLLALGADYQVAMLLPLVAMGVCAGILGGHAKGGRFPWDFYAFIGLGVLITIWQSAVAWLHMRSLLKKLATELLFFAVSEDDEVVVLSKDKRVAYVQVCLQNARLLGDATDEERLCLQFMRAELKEFDSSPYGFVVIDTAGVILYCNDALCAYFGHDRPSLLQENIRILMPGQYRRQHDHYLRRYLSSGTRRIIDTERHTPVVDSADKQSVVRLRVTEHIDPYNADNKVFVGRMKFNEVRKVAETLRERLNTIRGIEMACQCFDMHHDCIFVMDSRGVVEFANYPMGQLVGQSSDDLKGRSFSVLLPTSCNTFPNDFLERFALKKEADVSTGNLQEAWQEVVALGKDGAELKGLMHIERVECKGQLDGYVLVCNVFARLEQKLYPSDSSEHRMSVASSPVSMPSNSTMSMGSSGRRRHRSTRSRTSQGSVGATVNRLHLAVKKCTIVMIDLFGIQHGPKVAAPEYETFLTLLTQSCNRHKAHLHALLGDRAVVTFNTSVMNNSHRSSAGALMVHLTMTWNAAPSHANMKMLAVAATQEITCGTFGHQAVVVGEALDVCSAMLRVAAESRVANGLIDAALHEELQYLYECRLVNFVTFHPRDKRLSVRPVYELHALKSMTSEEWMYQVTHEAEQPRLQRWIECWMQLVGNKNNLGYIQPSPTPNFAAAQESLDAHLADYPNDAAALWLQQVLRRKVSLPGGDSMVTEICGKLQFFMHYRSTDRGSSARDISPMRTPAAAAAASPSVRAEDAPFRLRQSSNGPPEVPRERSLDTVGAPKHRGREAAKDRRPVTEVLAARAESEGSVISEPELHRSIS